jgi:hypothetical protein
MAWPRDSSEYASGVVGLNFEPSVGHSSLRLRVPQLSPPTNHRIQKFCLVIEAQSVAQFETKTQGDLLLCAQ